MGVGAGLYMYDVVVKKFTFAISSLMSSCDHLQKQFSDTVPNRRDGQSASVPAIVMAQCTVLQKNLVVQ